MLFWTGLVVALGVFAMYNTPGGKADPAKLWAIVIPFAVAANCTVWLGKRPSVPCSATQAVMKFVMSWIIAVVLWYVSLSFLLPGLHGDASDAVFACSLFALIVMATAIYKLVYKGPSGRWRAHVRETASAPATRPAWPQQPVPQCAGNVIESLCRKTGWVVTRREADIYQVRSGDHRQNVYIEIRYSERSPNVVFQSFFPIRFSLTNPPNQLFARVLLRTASLSWASWALNIGENCDAQLCVNAGVPTTALDARLFGKVCDEIADEVRGMRQELHEKFSYDLGGVMPQALPREMRVELPVRRSWHLPKMLGGG